MNSIVRIIENLNEAWLQDFLPANYFLRDKFSHFEYEQKIKNGIRFHFNCEITPKIIESFNYFISQHDPFYKKIPLVGGNLAIAELLEEKYKMVAFNLIDFSRHLKPEIALDKTTIVNNDGRKNNTDYFYSGQLIARIRHVYRNTPNTPIMCRYAEVLNYVLVDGESFSPDILIKDKTYQFLLADDLRAVINEREQSRSYLINYISGICLGVLLNSIPDSNTDSISELVAPFMMNNRAIMDEFILLGTASFKNFLIAIDLETTPYQWLNYFAAPSVTLRDFIVSSITYETNETHLDITLP